MSEKPNIVVDTNVLVNAMIAEFEPHTTVPAQVRDYACLQHILTNFQICFTQKSVEEFAKVVVDLDERHEHSRFSSYARICYVNRIQARSKKVDAGHIKNHCSHKEDDVILEAASGAKAVYIVSDDEHLWSMTRSRDILIVRPHLYNSTIAKGLSLDEYDDSIIIAFNAQCRGRKKKPQPTNSGHLKKNANRFW